MEKTKRILCYGDSNTYGYDPMKTGDLPEEVRFDGSVRWTALLSSLLGEKYTVLEEGFNGRTIKFDNGDPMRNGLNAVGGVIEEDIPVDVFVIMLGTNDCYFEEVSSAPEIRDSMRELVKKTAEECLEKQGYAPDVLIVAPPCSDLLTAQKDALPVNENEDTAAERRRRTGMRMTHEIVPLFEALAAELGCDYLDASDVMVHPRDGVHLSKEGHADLARRVFEKLTCRKGV